MHRKENNLLSLFLLLALAAALVVAGCSGLKSQWRKVSGTRAPDADLEEEAKTPPEAMQEEIIVDGKTYVRSKNPEFNYMPGEPEYIYAEKGTEFKGLTGMMVEALAKKLGIAEKSKATTGVPEDKVQEMVRKEVDRILKEQGLKALQSKDKSLPEGVVGRYVAVYPNPEASRSMAGASRTLAAALVDAVSRQKDLKVAGPDKVKASLNAAKVTGRLKEPKNLQALGDVMGVHALVLTGVVPPEGGGPGFLVTEVYDTFKGIKVDGIAYPVEGRPGADVVQKFARSNALRLSAALLEVEWFGRVEFTKEGNVYLSMGENSGLKVGDRLKVVTPGQEVINPTTRASLGFTADETQGMLKVTELLGESGAVAQVVNGGPFKANDKVKAVR
jgi:hypothetical protein